MKTIDAILLGVLANLLAWSAVAGTSTATNAAVSPPPAVAAAAATTNAAGEMVMPLVTMQDAPLLDVIKTLCGQARISYQLDPRVQAATGPDGKPLPPVTVRMENVSAREVLMAVLDNYGYQLVADPTTRISRVTLKDRPTDAGAITGVVTNMAANAAVTNGVSGGVKIAAGTNAAPPAPSLILEETRMPVAAGVNDTNAPVDLGAAQASAEAEEVMPLVTFEDAPLLDVIKTLCRQAKINFQFDPRIQSAVGPDGKPVPQPLVSLRLENVTARQVLMAVLTNYGYQLVLDPKTQISRITIKDPAAPEPLITRVIQLQYSNPTNMVMVIKSALPPPTRSMVIPDTRTSQLVVMATEKEMEAVDTLLKKLDTPTRQVLIEARLLETSQNPQSIKGIDWSGTLEAQHVSFGNGQTTSSSTTTTPGAGSSVVLPSGRTVAASPGSSSQSTYTTSVGPSQGGSSSSGSRANSILPSALPGGLSMNTMSGFSPNVAFLNADGVSAVLSFLNKDTDTEVLSTPRAVTLDNETATLEVTRAFPIFQITPGSANVAGGSQVQYTNMGTRLNVTPRISGSNNIALHVMPEVSNIDGKDSQTINGQLNVANIYAIRKIETHVVIPSGHTLVMGGLVSDSNTKAQTKVPILGDLPGIGLAFRKDSKTRLKQNLLIFITPSIVKTEDFQVLAETDFLKTKATDNSDKKTSAWDSGKPVDWSKPVKDQF